MAHQLNEVIAIYPIFPSSNTGEGADQWSFNTVKFIQVHTPAMRVKFQIAPNTEVGITEWRVGPERTVVLPRI